MAQVKSGQHKRWSELVMLAEWKMDLIKQGHPELPNDPLLWRPLASAIMEEERRGMLLLRGKGVTGKVGMPSVRAYCTLVFAERKRWAAGFPVRRAADVEWD